MLLVSLIYSAFKIHQIYKEEKEASKIKKELIEIIDIPDIPSEEPSFSVDFTKLKNINEDVVGWIVIEGTKINYPIVQGKNNTYYLNHSYDKKWSSFGSIFMDYKSSSDFLDYNTFIYGHHTKNGSMFGEIYKYLDESFYNEHPFFYLYTPHKNYKVEVFSAYVNKSNSNSYKDKFSSKEDYQNYLKYIIARNNYNTNVKIDFNKDKIITLYSCSRESNWAKNDRYFIHGKLIDLNE